MAGAATQPALSTAGRELLLEIARCPLLESVLDEERPAAPCAPIALSQWGTIEPAERVRHWRGLHQLPEPWVGQLEQALILFVSSNPSIRGSIDVQETQRAPGLAWSHADEAIISRYDGAFEQFIEDGIREHGKKRPVAYWSAVRRRAQELLERPPRPGIDYVLTEVVHCKSKREAGVAEARATCGGRYLERLIALSRAPLVVFLGRQAGLAAREALGVPADVGRKPEMSHLHRMPIGGRARLLAFLPHPNARDVRTPAACWTAAELAEVRRLLAAADEQRVRA